MGFMDKVKEQAAAAASAAKDATAKGQQKMDDMQAKRAADATLRQLGLVAYLDAAGRGAPDAETKAAGYVETLKAYEVDHGPLTAD
jgi:hypothetical protein